MVTVLGMMLTAPSVTNSVTDTTAWAWGGSDRDTMLCSATTTWAPATIGSIVFSGADAWPPRPRISISKRSS